MIKISRETEALLTDEARRQGVAVDVLLERLINEHEATVHPAQSSSEAPVWRLGGVGALHRRDIYNDVPRSAGSLMRMFWSIVETSQWTQTARSTRPHELCLNSHRALLTSRG